MLDILLWVLFLTCAEGGAVVLARWLWNMADETDSDGVQCLYITAFIFTVILAVGVGIMLVKVVAFIEMKTLEGKGRGK